ncbi:MAG: M15 family metallopeptidase [Candidatus Pacebacteria bacterium]|nr:M15 family metallopeptidase [Candidatus Paceibacterota bacterium]
MSFKPDFKFFRREKKTKLGTPPIKDVSPDFDDLSSGMQGIMQDLENIPNNEDFKILPIEEVSAEVKEGFKNKVWRKIPISETITAEPKHLEVVPNRPISGKAMAWPAYYKTVKEGLENDGKPKGVGELAQTMEGGIQGSPIVKIRTELKSKLDEAQKLLDSNPKTSNLQIVLVDGYRRVDVQKSLFDAYRNYVISQHPGISEEESRNLAIKMVSEPPSDPSVLEKCPPPHSTGGSADVVLVFKDKINIDSDYWLEEAMVPFGAKFDEMMHPEFRDERSETTFYEKKSDLTEDEKKALEFRRILYHTFTKVGFTNYFTEFWHYDFGNQFNALTAGKPTAQFGFAGGLENNKVREELNAERKAFEAYKAQVGTEEAERVKHHFGL